MISQIKYSYIPKNKLTDGILSSLTHALNKYGDYIDDFRIIDNKDLGIRIYPKEMKDCLSNCSQEDITREIIEHAQEEDVDLIIINGFDISLDEIRNVYCAIVEEYDIMLCINKAVDYDINSNVSVTIDPEIVNIEDSEWEIAKEEMLESLEDAAKKQAKKSVSLYSEDKENKDFLNSDSKLFEELLNIFDNAASSDELILSALSDIDEDIEEEYSHTINDSTLDISKTTEKNVVIRIEEKDEYVVVPKEHITFLIDCLEKFK